MEFPAELVKIISEQGITAPIAALIGFGLYIYERKSRADDRKAFDAALAQSTAEHVATLKIITPLAQKFSDTMDVILPLALAQLQRRGE